MRPTVPAVPEITARIHSDGTGVLTVDGLSTHLDDSHDQAATRRAILERVIATAAEVGHPVLLRTEDAEGSWTLEVTPAGQISDVTGAEHEHEPDRRLAFDDDLFQEFDADDAVVEDTAVAVAAERAPRGLRRARGTTASGWGSGRRLRRWLPVAAVAIGVGILGAVLAALLLPPSGGSSSAGAGSVVMLDDGLDVTHPPAEWASPALWRSPALLPAAGRVLVVQGTAVAMVTADRQVALVDADGTVRWSKPLPAGEVHSRLAITTIGGQNVLAEHVGDVLAFWAIEDGTPGSTKIGADATATYFGASPLIGIGPGTVATLATGSPIEVQLPSGATGFAAGADGTVTAASSAGWWRLTPGDPAGDATRWVLPTGIPAEAQVAPVAWMHDHLITVATAGATTEVVVVEGSGMQPAFSAPITLPGNQLSWRASTSERWGILGRSLIDTDARRVTDLGDGWTTTQIASDRALGQIGTQRIIAGPEIAPGVLAEDEGFPEDLLILDDKTKEVGALVRVESADSRTSIYTLPPRK